MCCHQQANKLLQLMLPKDAFEWKLQSEPVGGSLGKVVQPAQPDLGRHFRGMINAVDKLQLVA